jgi:hypothetical protein
MYDIVFISYKEPNAEDNWKNLKLKNKFSKRIHGVKGIHRAHIAAASIAVTDMVWVVDGDAVLMDDFNFDFKCNDHIAKKTVHVWRSRNPINGLVYGYGGVKLLPRKLTVNMDLSKPDMTTGISSHFKPVNVISNITAFNTDPYSTWRSAFRECAKLSSKIIDRQKSFETIERLDTWCKVGEHELFGEYSISGSIAGRKFGELFPDQIFRINDFNWLEEKFKEEYGKIN